MKFENVKLGQKVTVFRPEPTPTLTFNNAMLGKIGTVNGICNIGDGYPIKVGFDNGSTGWFPPEMLELTPDPAQIKVGARVQIADNPTYKNVSYTFATGTIECSDYTSFDNICVVPDSLILRQVYPEGIWLTGLNRFTILDDSPAPTSHANHANRCSNLHSDLHTSTKFARARVNIEVWPSNFDGVSHKLEFEVTDIPPSNLRGRINKFVEGHQ